jgi:hypothetical protein
MPITTIPIPKIVKNKFMDMCRKRDYSAKQKLAEIIIKWVVEEKYKQEEEYHKMRKEISKKYNEELEEIRNGS